MLSKFSLIRLRTKKQRTLVVFVAWLHTSSGGYRSTPASVWFVGVTRFVCAEITRINERRARRLQTRSLELKSLQAGVFLFTPPPPPSFFLASVPSVQTLGVIGTAITGEFPWHQIRLFVNAEHRQRFIFIRWISSVTYSENSDWERTPLWHSGRGGASKHPNNYTGSRVTSGWLSFFCDEPLCARRG